MKIAFDHQAFTMQRHGGVSRYFTKLAPELSNLNQEVMIFGGLYQNHYLAELSSDLVRGKGIKSYPKRTGFIADRFNHIFTEQQILTFSPDIFHETFYTPHHPKKANCPRVVTVHDMIYELFPENFPKNKSYSRSKRRAVERADHIISVSQNTKNDLINIFNIPADKIDVVHLGIDFPEIVEDIPYSIQKPYIMYVGDRRGYKNFELLLKVLADNSSFLSECSLLAFGGGDFTTDEKRLFSKLGLEPRYIIHKSGNDMELWKAYANATAFVYPSQYEGFGLPPLEAMSLGCPVISSNSSSMPEIIGDAAEFFDPKDPGALFKAISKVTSSLDYQEKLRALGRRRAEQFSWRLCAEQTLQVYQKLSF